MIFFRILLRIVHITVILYLLTGTDRAFADSCELAFQQGHFERAARCWQNEREQMLDKKGCQEIQLKLATAYQMLGLYKEAFTKLSSLLCELETNENTFKIKLLTRLGQFTTFTYPADLQEDKTAFAKEHSCFDDYLEFDELTSYQFLQRAEKLAREANQPYLLADVLNEMGTLLMTCKECSKREPLEVYQESLTLARKIADKSLQVKILVNRVKATLNKGDNPADTVKSLETALTEAKLLNSSYIKSSSFIMLSQVAKNEDIEFDSEVKRNYYISQSLNYAIQSAEETQDFRSLSIAHGYLGDYYEKIEHNDELALKETRQALFFAQQGGLITPLPSVRHCADSKWEIGENALPIPEFTYRWYWQLGRLLKKRQQTDAAIEAYRQAVAQLKLIRKQLMTIGYHNDPVKFKSEIISVYTTFVDLLTQRAQQGDLEDARETLEQLRKGELSDYLQMDECDLPSSEDEPKKEDDKNIAVIYPIISLDDENVKPRLLLQLKDSLQIVPIDIKSGKVSALAKKMAEACVNEQTPNDCRDTGTELYLWLMEPLIGKLGGEIKTLIIVPDSVTRQIPFSALRDEKEGRFLIEKYRLAFVQGMEITAREKPNLKGAKIFLGGISEQLPNYERFKPLPHVKGELKGIQELFAPPEGIILKEDILLNEKFDRDSIEKMFLKNYNIIHFATHAKFGKTAKEAFILVYKEELFLDKLGKLVQGTNAIELMTLSACETSKGDDNVVLGLAGTTVKAGAHSALGSLWEVDDESTGEFMKTFYSHLKNDKSKAEALQQAQIDLLRNPKYQPYHWAPFILVGNWQ